MADVLNSVLLAATLGVAGTIGAMTIDHGQKLSSIESTLESHTKIFDELTPVLQSHAIINQRMDQLDKRSDHMEAHIDATDKRVDDLEYGRRK